MQVVSITKTKNVMLNGCCECALKYAPDYIRGEITVPEYKINIVFDENEGFVTYIKNQGTTTFVPARLRCICNAQIWVYMTKSGNLLYCEAGTDKVVHTSANVIFHKWSGDEACEIETQKTGLIFYRDNCKYVKFSKI